MADLPVAVLLTLWAIWWPISKVLNAVIFLFSPVWRVGSFVLLPFIHLAQTIISIITFPFSVRWLDRIETLYVFLGTAGLIGCITGGLLYITFRFMSSSLRINSSILPRKEKQPRSAAEYRATRRERQEEAIHSLPSRTPVVLKKVAGPRRRGLLSQAIIEEEDSDF